MWTYHNNDALKNTNRPQQKCIEEHQQINKETMQAMNKERSQDHND
jgi:hypothetical protein